MYSRRTPYVMYTWSIQSFEAWKSEVLQSNMGLTIQEYFGKAHGIRVVFSWRIQEFSRMHTWSTQVEQNIQNVSFLESLRKFCNSCLVFRPEHMAFWSAISLQTCRISLVYSCNTIYTDHGSTPVWIFCFSLFKSIKNLIPRLRSILTSNINASPSNHKVYKHHCRTEIEQHWNAHVNRLRIPILIGSEDFFLGVCFSFLNIHIMKNTKIPQLVCNLRRTRTAQDQRSGYLFKWRMESYWRLFSSFGRRRHYFHSEMI